MGQMPSYNYQGNEIMIPRGAEVTTAFSPGNVFHNVIQAALDDIEPWERGNDPIETFPLGQKIGARVVALAEGELPTFWAVSAHHKARNPGRSPFLVLERDDSRQAADEFTLELAGTPTSPLLTRIYPGDYMPPLPWMNSAGNAPGGKDECVDFWNENAFVLRDLNAVEQPGFNAPDWFRHDNSPLLASWPGDTKR